MMLILQLVGAAIGGFLIGVWFGLREHVREFVIKEMEAKKAQGKDTRL